ncbi:MAG: dihydropteroate synthase [Lewinellaceae bacterium]|nr:dihydropteroate synthase [Lewinellaceae bacterium]
MLFQRQTLNCGGRLLSLAEPQVMGILNVTPDSFYDGGAYTRLEMAIRRAEALLAEGATIIDVGGMSSRPGALPVPVDEELSRVMPVIEGIHRQFPEAILSVDTIHSRVAREAASSGVGIINDISAGSMDPAMYATVAELQLPYVLMHMQGTPQSMQQNPDYVDVVQEVLDFFIAQAGRLRAAGVKDIIIDPGFGFGKSISHNYQLLSHLHVFRILEFPVLAGISRKSMIYKLLDITAAEALPATAALHLMALQQGARILRVHDAKEAHQVITLWQQLQQVTESNKH